MNFKYVDEGIKTQIMYNFSIFQIYFVSVKTAAPDDFLWAFQMQAFCPYCPIKANGDIQHIISQMAYQFLFKSVELWFTKINTLLKDLTQGLICQVESKPILRFYVTFYLMTSYTYKGTFLPLRVNDTQQKDFL